MQQQNLGQTQQPPLTKQPPAVITTKDLLYLKDHLSWQLNAMKKCAHYARECQDPQLRQALDKAGSMHQRHYQTLLTYCQYNNAKAMAAVSQQPQQSQPQQQNGSF